MKDIDNIDAICEGMYAWTNNISMQVQETEDEFIFSTINKWIGETFARTISKDELAKAIQIVRACEEHGINLYSAYDTATEQQRLADEAYRKGFADGYESVMQGVRMSLNEHDLLQEMVNRRKNI